MIRLSEIKTVDSGHTVVAMNDRPINDFRVVLGMSKVPTSVVHCDC